MREHNIQNIAHLSYYTNANGLLLVVLIKRGSAKFSLEKSPNEDRLPWRRRAPPRPPPTKGRPWDHRQPAPERPEGHQCRLAARRGGASGPGPSRPFRARRTAPERTPSERRRSAITTRPQACRASNTCSHKGGGSERHGRQGDCGRA